MSSNQLLHVLIIEDEEPIRSWMIKAVSQFDDVEVVGSADSLNLAFQEIVSKRPHLIFLDARLIGGDAFQLLERLRNANIPIPYIVMTTGYPEYAIDSINNYKDYVVKYFKKPLIHNWETNFRSAIDATWANINKNNVIASVPSDKNTIFLKINGNLIRLDINNLLWAESAGDGQSFLMTHNKEEIKVDITLKKLVDDILPDNFVQISKFCIVNTNKIDSINKGDRTLIIHWNNKSYNLSIGELYYANLINKLSIIK